MNARFSKRLSKELSDLTKAPPPGVSIKQADRIDKWIITIVASEGTLYAGETFVCYFVVLLVLFVSYVRVVQNKNF